MKEESTALSSGIIIGIVVAALVIVLIIIDISCCVVNRAGLLAMICLKNKKEPKEQDIKNECREQEPLKTINSNKYSVHDEEMQRTEAPLIPTENVKRDTAVDFDFKNATSRTTFVKNSAV